MSSESGPCYVNLDSNSTTLNPWSFNNHVNMLYIDQPVQAGFSYAALVNGTLDLLGDIINPEVFTSTNIPPTNSSFGFGTFPDQNPRLTTNNTIQSTRALWHFAENWLSS